MDVAPPPSVETGVRRVAAAVPGVQAIDKCRVRKMGLDFYVDIHVQVDGSMSVREGHRIAHQVKDAVRAVWRETLVAFVLLGVGTLAGYLLVRSDATYAAALTTVFYPAASEAVIYIIMAIVLLIRPRGLLGEEGMLS